MKALHFCALSLGFFIVFTNLPKSPSVDFIKALIEIVVSKWNAVETVCHLPADHVGTFIDVWHTVHETLDARESLSEVTLGIVAVV